MVHDRDPRVSAKRRFATLNRLRRPFRYEVEDGQSPSDSDRLKRAGDSGPTGVAQGKTRQQASKGRTSARFSVRSYMGRKTSRGDIVIGRPALSLKALPSTHDTISHTYGLDDGEVLPVA
jgi:hypothetical protein